MVVGIAETPEVPNGIGDDESRTVDGVVRPHQRVVGVAGEGSHTEAAGELPRHQFSHVQAAISLSRFENFVLAYGGAVVDVGQDLRESAIAGVAVPLDEFLCGGAFEGVVEGRWLGCAQGAVAHFGQAREDAFR